MDDRRGPRERGRHACEHLRQGSRPAAGFYVYGTREYYSNIKGEHSYFQVRFGREFLRSHVNTVDMLATFDDETVARHAFEVRKDGAIVFDKDRGGQQD